jgi:hypothetical protein
MSRPCRQCGAAIGRTVETCPQCGTFNRAQRTVWVWLVGGAIVLTLFLALGDIGAALGVAGNLLRQIRAALAPAQ